MKYDDITYTSCGAVCDDINRKGKDDKDKIRVILNTGSSIKQGCITKSGRKLSKEYKEEVAVCYLNPADLRDLWYNGCGEYPGKVKVTTDEGEVVVFAREDTGVSKNCAFMPRGPWANVVITSETHGTGSPLYKGMSADITLVNEAEDGDVLECKELIMSIGK